MATISFENGTYGRRVSAEEAIKGLRIIVRRFIGVGDDERVEERTGIVGVPVDTDRADRIGSGPVARMILVDVEDSGNRLLVYGDEVDRRKVDLLIHPDQEPLDGGDTIRLNGAVTETHQTAIS